MSPRESRVDTWDLWRALEVPRWRPSSLLAILLMGGLLIGSWHITEIEPSLLFGEQGRRHMWAFASGLFPPNVSPAFLKLLMVPAIETIQISIMGTVLAILL